MYECNVLWVFVVKLNKKLLFIRDSYVFWLFVKWYINVLLIVFFYFCLLFNVLVVIGLKWYLNIFYICDDENWVKFNRY